MSGQYTRLRYDNEAYAEELHRSVEPGMYMLDPDYANNCGKCFAPYGPRAGYQDAVANGEQIDIDSVLRGVNKINTRSNVQQVPDSIDGYQLRALNDCPNGLETEYSRFTYPAYDIRGLTTRDLNFEYPLFDPQCQIFENFAVDTRLQAKDNHRAVWQVPLDQKDLLPTERLGGAKQCGVSSDCRYAKF